LIDIREEYYEDIIFSSNQDFYIHDLSIIYTKKINEGKKAFKYEIRIIKYLSTP
jgi:hypothetical protein